MESISLPFAQLIIQLLGLPGLIFIVWHFDNKRQDKQRGQYEEQQHLLREAYEREHKKDRDMVLSILNQYKDDVGRVSALYQSNAHLVCDYEKAVLRLEKLAEEMMSVVSLNAHTNTHLADAIKNNSFCPQVRKELGRS